MRPPQFTVAQANSLLKYFLPRVSRTFALNITRLSTEESRIIGIAYLICRILDTLEDAPEQAPTTLLPQQKITLLNHFANLLKNNAPASAYTQWLGTVYTENSKHHTRPTLFLSENPYENELVAETATVLGIYNEFDPAYQEALKGPIIAMAEGMARFIHRYQGETLKILQTYEELVEYCGIVAGTVGTILTQIFALTPHSPEQLKTLQTHSADFALSLQLVNIVKDFSKDQTRGWVYIPLSLLTEHELTPEDFLHRRDPEKCKKIQLSLLTQIEGYLENALRYTQALAQSSAKERRHRIFCWLPLIMATQTVALLRKQPISPEEPYHSKISRQQILLDLLTAPLLSRSNFLLSQAFSCALKKSNKPPTSAQPNAL